MNECSIILVVDDPKRETDCNTGKITIPQINIIYTRRYQYMILHTYLFIYTNIL